MVHMLHPCKCGGVTSAIIAFLTQKQRLLNLSCKRVQVRTFSLFAAGMQLVISEIPINKNLKDAM